MKSESFDSERSDLILQMFLFASVYLIWNYGTFISINVGGPIDKSWVVGLNWASFLKLPWSENSLVFTYGPLYYLSGIVIPELHPWYTSWLVNNGLTIFFIFGAVYTYFIFYSRFRQHPKSWLSLIAAGVLILQGMKTEAALYFSIFVFLYPLIDAETRNRSEKYTVAILRYLLVSLILALLPFIKFSFLFPSVILIISMMICLVLRRLFKDSLILGAFFCLETLLLWILATGTGIASFFSYLAPRLVLSNGYSEAMMLDFTMPVFDQLLIFTILMFFLFGISALHLVMINKIDWVGLWILPMISLFFGFKSAFVRADAHVLKIFDHIFFVLLLYLYMLYANSDSRAIDLKTSWRARFAEHYSPFLLFMFLSSFTFWAIQYSIENRPRNLLPSNTLARNEFSATHFKEIYQQEFLKSEYNLDNSFIRQIDPNQGIDVVPWDIALLYAYGLHWQPRPVIQSYASFTAGLDNLDAEFFKSNAAPSQILFSTFTIDGRYFLFDTPKTFQSILSNYDITAISQNGRYALLKKKDQPVDSMLVLISEETARFSKKNKIPDAEGAHVIMTVDLKPTVLGKLVNTFYRIPPIDVVFSLKDGEKVHYRFVRDVGQNGLFVSKYVRNLQDLKSVFANTYEHDIESITFEGDPKYYQPSFLIRFYELTDRH